MWYQGRKYKKIALAFATISIAFSANAWEWGGQISGAGKLKNGQANKINDFDTNTLEATADAKAWIKVPFDENGNNYAIAEGDYNFKYKRAEKETSKEPYLDLDLLKIVLTKDLSKGKLSASLGRFALSDLSSLIYSQNADGALIRFDADSANFSVYGGYTGLLNGRTLTILSTDDSDTYEDDTDKLYKLAEKFVATSISASFPNLIQNHSLSAEVFGAFRLKGDSYTRIYGTLAMNGPIVPEIFYCASGTVSYKKYDAGDISDVGALLQGTATYYPEFKDSSLGISAIFANKTFTGFTSQTAVNAQSELQYNGILKAGVFGSIKPVKNLLVSANCNAVCFYDTPIVSGAANSSGDFGFHGLQFGGGATYQIFSDFSVGVSATQFLDTKKENSDLSKTTLEIKASLTF